MQLALALALLLYLVAMFALALKARGRIQSTEDFLVAGRRLSFPLATATLFATWFGAGSLLASTDEVKAEGLRALAMEPLGAGLCLVLAGLFFARPLWRAQLLTLADFYRDRFGRRAELAFSLSLYTYLGWIAAQLVSLAGISEIFFGVPLWLGVVVWALLALAYTLIGGMWSVALTDAVQLIILLIGLAATLFVLFTGLGHGDLAAGLALILERVPPEHLELIPTERRADLWRWLNLLAIGSLGNLAGADLFQRVFSARSAGVAQAACVTSGLAYILVGVAPALLGLAAQVLLPEALTQSALPELARQTLSPAMTILFTLALVSAVLSTLDSALLSAASVAATNVLRPRVSARHSTLKLVQWCCVALTAASILFALLGESAFSLLEASYALTLAGPLVPLVLGLFWRRGDERAALASFVLGYGVTALEFILPEELLYAQPWPAPLAWLQGVPLPLLALLCSSAAYLFFALRSRPSPPPQPAAP